jgi:hypothetical protein
MPPAKLLRVDGSQDRSAPFAPDISRRSNPKPRSTYRRSPKSTSRRCRGEPPQHRDTEDLSVVPMPMNLKGEMLIHEPH